MDWSDFGKTFFGVLGLGSTLAAMAFLIQSMMEQNNKLLACVALVLLMDAAACFGFASGIR